MDNQRRERVDKISRLLLQAKVLDEADRYLSLDEFIMLYQSLSQSTGVVQEANIVLLGKNAAVQFPGVSRQRMVVRHGHRLTISDFAQTVVKPRFWGDRIDSSLWKQLKEEKRNVPILLTVFLAFLLSGLVIGFNASADLSSYLANPTSQPQVGQAIDALKAISELIITSATLFLSVFLVFTVTQNIPMAQDIFLFSEGLAHKYHRDDIFVTKSVLLSLFLGLINIVLLVTPVTLQIATFNVARVSVTLNKLSLVSPLVVALSTTLLALCFLSILYYFTRTMAYAGTQMAEKILENLTARAPVSTDNRSVAPSSNADSQPSEAEPNRIIEAKGAPPNSEIKTVSTDPGGNGDGLVSADENIDKTESGSMG